MILCIIRLVRSYIMYAHTGVAILYLVCIHAYYIIYTYIWLQQLYFLIDDSCLFLSDPWIFARSPHVCTRIRIRCPLNTPHCYLKLDYLSCLLFPLLRRGARSIVIYWIVWHLLLYSWAGVWQTTLLQNDPEENHIIHEHMTEANTKFECSWDWN